MKDRDQLAGHLAFFEELGVLGISRDPTWRTRQVSRPGLMKAEGMAQLKTSEQVLPVAGRSTPIPPVVDEASVHGPGDTEGPQVRREAPAAVDVSMFDHVAVPDEGTAAERLTLVRQGLGDCTRCKLHKHRTTLVYGVGNPGADLMFVGEAPGRDEDLQGIPFVGRAGQLLTKIIESIGLKRDDVYIANVIKCRPPDNRHPEPEEVSTCEPFLFAQIDAIKPRVVVALGACAARTLLRIETAISKVRGRVFDYRGAKLIATFHPAFLLRSPNRKRDVWEDMKKVRSILQNE